ncbi:acetyltransferase [Parafrankia sp. BMG5.11]|uniref:acetyltransferase n=1 Tax=Parafrankia sp. BMG5.11 TaxID=222540 RepID=UPI00103B2EF2|nr:acetyltransferase [Parafrankia sp. BMG5.11]TCJ40240.1 acetyltransferase [Parafrankia sp. BMG5.11]
MGLVGIFGTGGCARGIMPLARFQFPGERLVFVEDVPATAECNGQPVVDFKRFVEEPVARIALAVANPPLRSAIARRCAEAGIHFECILAPDMIVMDDVKWGAGCLFSPGTVLTSNIRIGSHFHCNLYSYVEHDCRIGDFVTFGPGVRCNGGVTIGDNAYIGSGAMIRQGITIGAGATVGMGAVVVKDVPAGAVVIGNPATLIQSR